MKTLHVDWANPQYKAGAADTGLRLTESQPLLFVFKWLMLCLLPVAGLMNSSPAAAAQTIVSLTFDDGINQSQVADMLLFHGMKGTFYINSNLIGTGGGYLTKSELDTLIAYGNEIGGHTINHVDLATLSDAQQRTAICDDLQTLNSWYPGQIHSFAYPFASTGPTTQSILAAGCPGVGTYTNARTVGGLVSGSQCTDCATAESIPPGNPYYINTPESILSTTTLDEIKTLVTQAENNGGGWVPLVFHQVCNGCDLYSITPATLEAFLNWLQAREATNNTYVRTVEQVMTGDLPPPPPPPPLGPNQLINPSLELDQDANSVADCWLRDSNGVNTATWTRTSDAHEGVFGEQVQVTAYSSGDLKLIQTLDVGQAFGGCAPTVETDASYQLGAWYKSTTPVIPVVFSQDAAGVWQYWRDGPLLPASSNWAEMTFNTGPVPAGIQAISFGIALNAVGTLTTDDYSMQRVLDGTPDTTAPAVTITAPAAGTVSGTVTVSADATDDTGVVGVQFQLDGTNLGAEVTAAPYSLSWDSTIVTNGSHTLTAVARDAADNTASSSGVTVTVDNTIAVNSPPVTVADSYNGVSDSTLKVTRLSGVLSNDTDADGDTLQALLDTGTTNGTVTLWTGGAFSYTPNPGFSGVDSFTYHAFDGTANGNTVQVTLNITGSGTTPPVTVTDSYGGASDTTLAVTSDVGVLSNDTDADGDTLQAVLDTGTTNGTVTLWKGGAFRYIPNPGFSGLDSFTYHAFDGTANGNTVQVTLNITGSGNTPPVTVADSYSGVSDTALSVTSVSGVLSNDTDADGDTLQAVLDTGPSNGTVTLWNGGAFRYIPNPGFSGVDSFTYHAFDGTAAGNTVQVTLNINTSANAVPVTVADSYNVAGDTTLNVPSDSGVLSNDTDADGDTLQAVLDTGTTNGTVTLWKGGAFRYIPNPGFSGVDSFTYHAFDGTMAGDSVQVTLNIAAP